MVILLGLIIFFGLVTIYTGACIAMANRSAVRWRGRTVAFTRNGQDETRSFGDITDHRSSLWGWHTIGFRDGMTLKLDRNASGADELLAEIGYVVFSVSNDADKDLIIYVEPNPDRYTIAPDKTVRIIGRKAENQLEMSAGPAEEHDFATLWLFLEDSDVWAEVDGKRLVPWS